MHKKDESYPLASYRLNREPRVLALVPIAEVEAPKSAKPSQASPAKLPSILIPVRVKTYRSVIVGRRRMSLSSRGAVSTNPSSAPIMKTVPVVREEMLDLAPIIEKYATKHRLDPWLVRAVIEVESTFRPQAVSSAGAGGLMQLMPATAAHLGCKDRFNPEQNIAAGSRYLRQLLDRFGSIDLMLAAYNAGPGNVSRYGGIPPFSQTQRYVVKVKRAWKQARITHAP